MLARKISPGASHAGHHFVGDQQHAVAATIIRDRRHVSWRGRDRSKRRAAYRFKDEGRDFTFCCLNGAFQFGGILLSAVSAPVGAMELAPITRRNTNVRKLAHHRKINLAPSQVAENGERTES